MKKHRGFVLVTDAVGTYIGVVPKFKFSASFNVDAGQLF